MQLWSVSVLSAMGTRKLQLVGGISGWSSIRNMLLWRWGTSPEETLLVLGTSPRPNGHHQSLGVRPFQACQRPADIAYVSPGGSKLGQLKSRLLRARHSNLPVSQC